MNLFFAIVFYVLSVVFMFCGGRFWKRGDKIEALDAFFKGVGSFGIGTLALYLWTYGG